MKFRLFLLCILMSCCLSAQNRQRTIKEVLSIPGTSLYDGVYRFSPPSYRHADITHSLKIGDSRLRIEYDIKVLCDTMSTTRYQDKLICLVGDDWIWTYGESSWIANMRFTLPLGHPDEKKYMRSEGCVEVIASSVYRDLKTGNLINYGLIPEIRNTMFRYDERLPNMNWELTSETEEVQGYVCQKAVTDYAGRKWSVWFSSEVPVDCGLWKFNGLPGLIMKAVDSKEEYIFNLTYMELRQEDIVIYPKIEKVVSREQYRKSEKSAHDDPIMVAKGADGYFLIISEERNLTGREVFTSGHYLYPYNPLELE